MFFVEANPDKFSSRFGNKLAYAKYGGLQFMKFNGTSRELYKHVRIICDGKDETKRLSDIHAVSVSILNIRSFSSGYKPWGDSSRFPASISDKKFEVLGFSQQQFANMYLSNGTGERIGQCSDFIIKINHPLAIQIDGEAIMLDKPCSLHIFHRNQHRVLIRQKHAHDEPIYNAGDMTRVNIVEVCRQEIIEEEEEELFKETRLGSVDLPLDLDLETIRPKIELMLAETENGQSGEARKDFYYIDAIGVQQQNQNGYAALDKSKELTLLRDFLTDKRDVIKIRTDTRNCQRTDLQEQG